MRKLSIACLLFFRQRMKLWILSRNLVVRIKIAQTEISGICQNTDLFGKQTAAFFEQIKVMFPSIGKGCGNDRLRLLVDDQLCFLGVTLLFATVVLALLFFGRSIG